MINQFLTSWNAAISAFRRSWEDPNQGGIADDPTSRIYDYNTLWSYYNNTAWTDIRQWSFRKQRFQLYRAMRGIYNPVRRLVDLYAGAVYPGVLSEDASELPDGVPIAIPFARDTPPQLKSAIAQLWQWSNWQAGKSIYTRYGAALGSSFVEIVDNTDNETITFDVIWPGFITQIDIDKAGNVKSYTIEYLSHDASGQFVYTRTVDAEAYRTYRDGKPYAYGLPATYPNPYGFVPAVWANHRAMGGTHGSPAIGSSLAKVDELNSIASHIHDQIHKKINAPAILWSRANIDKLNAAPKRPADENDFSEQQFSDERETILFLRGPEGGRVDSLAGTLELQDALPYINQLIQEIADDHPELTAYKELRKLSQLTGPAASRIVGDAAANIYEASANYDQQTIKLFQMGVAIAGWRQATTWANATKQHAKFAPYNLDSYVRGNLDFAIMPRPILPTTISERANELVVQMQALKTATDAGIPLKVFLDAQLNWPRDVIARIPEPTQPIISPPVARLQTPVQPGANGNASQ
jgi:hypothetical protein